MFEKSRLTHLKLELSCRTPTLCQAIYTQSIGYATQKIRVGARTPKCVYFSETTDLQEGVVMPLMVRR